MKSFFCALSAVLLPLALSAAAQTPAPIAPREAGRIRIVLTGDSTVNAGGGWGSAFCALLRANVECINQARNGRSSKSFYDEGLWKAALDLHPDYVLIQFGHNDMPGKGPLRESDPQTAYPANLRRYVQEARAAGARPVLVTSLSRRTFKDDKLVLDLQPWADAARRVAAEEKVPLIDLNADSVRLLETMTQQQADQFNAEAHPDAKGNTGPDRTHLNPAGGALFGCMVAADLAKACPELAAVIQSDEKTAAH